MCFHPPPILGEMQASQGACVDPPPGRTWLQLATRSPSNRRGRNSKLLKRWSPPEARGTMADKKWLLGPGPLEPMPLDVTCKPWYKDKLLSKCFAKHKNVLPKFPTSLDSRRWIFVKELLDDFRKGWPPCEDLITRSPKEGFLPWIVHRVPQHAPKKGQKKLPEEANPFSTLSPAQLAQKAFVENIEPQLTKHPLALYPNLEENLPADLLLKVLEVLDPDGKLEDTRAYCQGPRKRTKSPTKLRKKRPGKVYLEPPKKAPVSHPATLHHEDKKSSREDSLTDPPVHREVPKAIRKSFQWAAAFGNLGIDEELITKLCEVGCEWPPAQDTVYMRKVTQVPSKVKYSIGIEKMEKIKITRRGRKLGEETPETTESLKTQLGGDEVWCIVPEAQVVEKASK